MQGIMMEDGESKTAEEQKVSSDRTVIFEQFTNCDGLAWGVSSQKPALHTDILFKS